MKSCCASRKPLDKIKAAEQNVLELAGLCADEISIYKVSLPDDQHIMTYEIGHVRLCAHCFPTLMDFYCLAVVARITIK